LSTIKDDFTKLSNRTIESLNALQFKDKDKSFFKHPIFGFLNGGHSIAFLYAHAKHHKKQIDRLVNLAKFKN
jgi:hypothetical protein